MLFIKSTSAHLFEHMHLVGKNTNLSVIRTPHCYNTKLIILFFIRTSNFCMRLDAQNLNTHRRLRLFLYFLPSWISLNNTCENVDYQLNIFCIFVCCVRYRQKNSVELLTFKNLSSILREYALAKKSVL